MRLITAHRILIAAAIAFAVLYALLQGRQWGRGGSAWALGQALLSLVVAVGLGLYYRTLRRWGR